MKHRFPLYLKIVLWFFLNLLLLVVIGFFFFAGHFGLDLLVSGPVAARISVATETINSELRNRPYADWNTVLENHSSAYGVRFVLFKDDGTQLAGDPTELPQEVKQGLRGPMDRGRRWFGENHFRPGTNEASERLQQQEVLGGLRRADGGIPAPGTNFVFRPGLPQRPRFVIRTSSPTRYWVGMPSFL